MNFIIVEKIWKLIAVESTLRPAARWQHCMVATKEHLYIFGGSDTGGRILADIWRYIHTILYTLVGRSRLDLGLG
jgi:hypothetical protein